MAAVEFRVEPEPRLEHDRRSARIVAVAEPRRDDTARVRTHEARGVRLRPVGNHLHQRSAARLLQAGIEILRNDHESLQFPRDHLLCDFPSIPRRCHVEEPRAGKRGREFLCVRAVALEHDGDRHATLIQRQREGEHDHQHRRQRERHENRRRIAQYLQTLLVDESVEATNAEAGAHAASRMALSAASTSPTNASSIVGDGRSALATRAFSASGEPSAITFA